MKLTDEQMRKVDYILRNRSSDPEIDEIYRQMIAILYEKKETELINKLRGLPFEYLDIVYDILNDVIDGFYRREKSKV
jgi:hypothetical protein